MSSCTFSIILTIIKTVIYDFGIIRTESIATAASLKGGCSRNYQEIVSWRSKCTQRRYSVVTQTRVIRKVTLTKLIINTFCGWA